MGLNLSLQTIDGQDHPNWDDTRYSGDRDIPGIISTIPHETHQLDECTWLERPTDFQAFRALLAKFDFNEDRWARLADILEGDPSYWIYFSY